MSEPKPNPYREQGLRLVVPALTELWPYCEGKRIFVSRGLLPPAYIYFGECAKCGRDGEEGVVLFRRLCVGGRYGFMWLWRCYETREHFHVKCRTCGWRAFMATKDDR